MNAGLRKKIDDIIEIINLMDATINDKGNEIRASWERERKLKQQVKELKEAKKPSTSRKGKARQKGN